MSTSRPASLRRVLLTHELALLCLLVVTGILAGVSAYFWHETSAESIRINRLLYEAQQIRSDLFRQIKEVTLARLMEDQNALGVYTRYSREIDRRFNVLRQRSASKLEDNAIQDMQSAYRALQVDMNKIFADPYLMNRVVRIKILDPMYEQTLVGGFERSFDAFRELMAMQGRDLERTAERWTRVAWVLIPVPILLAVLLLLLSRRSLQRGFVRPVANLMAGARRISEGKLDDSIPQEGVAELAELAGAVNHMAVELARSRDALVESEKSGALGALVPVVAHNIRNPLASIRATAQLIDHADSPEEQQEIKQAIIETVDRLGRWVSALVSYLHPLKPHPRRTNPTGMIDAAVALLAGRIEDRGMEVARERWDTESLVDVDVDLMEQALYGLLSNAVDASPAKGKLLLGACREEDRYVITIADQGPGMPFQPVPSGLAPGPSTKRMGTGLGIPVAFKVCKAHGWTIDFAPNEGGGTRITITAPLAAEDESEEETYDRTAA